ncbi:MAG: U32 family peptidase [Clostridiales bacterium]|jgi:putative protease|nr:U32 family peptidase [Clostridiales bacterium]
MNNNSNNPKPELLAPAGDMEKLIAACEYGADAVYIGGGNYNLRAGAKNFGADETAQAAAYAHKRGVKVYAAVNIFAHNEDLGGMVEYFTAIKHAGIDALIISDPGVFDLARKTLPDTDIHISTQANNTNYAGVLFWGKRGAKRAVLARELSFNEIAQISEKTAGKVELEVFVHGAMCVSYSGRCLLSNYLNERDSNRGMCSQPCRWKYALSEKSREGEFFQVEEDSRGTYILNSKDLCMIEYIPELIKSGAVSFKIEGRNKTPYYVAAVTKAYREAIDDYFESPEKYLARKNYYMDEILKVSNREFTTGFYFTKPDGSAQIYCGDSYVRTYDFIGVVLGYDEKTGLAKIEQRNKFSVGDTAEFLTPKGGGASALISEMYNENMESILSAPHPKQIVYVKTGLPVKALDFMRKRML